MSKGAKRKLKLKEKIGALTEQVEQAKRFKGAGKGERGEESRGQGDGGKAKGKGTHPRKDAKGRFVTDRDGNNICFGFGTGECSGVCPKGFVHLCQWCLGNHMTKDHKPSKK